MPNDDFSEIGKQAGPDLPETPGPDPRMSREYIDSIMKPGKLHMQPQSTYTTAAQAAPAGETNSLNNLIARLEQVNQYVGNLHGYITSLNDRLSGPFPQPEPNDASASPSGCLAYGHCVVDSINSRLSKIEEELRRFESNIGN